MFLSKAKGPNLEGSHCKMFFNIGSSMTVDLVKKTDLEVSEQNFEAYFLFDKEKGKFTVDLS